MTDLATLGLRFETQGAERAEKTLDNLASKADRAERATDGLVGGSRRLSGATMQMLASIERAVQELVQLQRAQQQFTIGLAEGAAAAVREAQALNTASGAMNAYGASATKAAAAQNVVAVSSRRAAAGTGLAGHEMLNFGRQMSDVGMMLALGQSPFMVLLQQGPQVADIFQTAKMRGVSFGQAMGSVFGAIRPFVPLLVGVGTAAAVAFGGAALAARAVNKDVGDLSKGLGLTEAQMKRLKEEGVNTGVTIGDVFRGTFNYIAGAVGKTLEPVAKWFSKLFDDMTRWAVAGVKGIVGALVGGFNAIKAVWKQLPAAMGDVAISAANAVIQAIESMINKALQAYNKALPLIRGLMLATGNIGGAMGLRQAGSVSLGRLDNLNAGAAAGAIDAGRAAFDEGRKAGEGWVDGVGKGLKDAWLKAAEDRIKAATGDAGAGRKARERAGPKGPSAEDMDEQFAQRRADIERQIEQAKMEELQAQLALTVEVRERAELERQVARQQAAVKAAQLKAQLERIKNDDKLTDAAKQELAAMLLGVAIRQGNVARMQQQAINEREQDDLRREASAVQEARIGLEIEVLRSQSEAAASNYERAKIALKILDAERQIERLKLEEIIASNAATQAEKDIARARLEQLDVIYGNRRKAAEQDASLANAMTEAVNAVGDMVQAFKRHDWGALLSNLSKALKDISGLMPEGSGLGGALGKVGKWLGPIGGLVSAVTGLFGGLFGGNSEKKRQRQEEEARRREEAARRAAEIAAQARDLEIRLMEVTGDAVGALAARRAQELEGVDESNRALLDHILNLEQARTAQQQYNDLFLTEQERLVQTAAELGDGFKSLNLAVPQSMAEFKALADGIDRTTAAGQQLFAGLMALGPAFAQVAGYISSLQGAAAALTPYQAAQGAVSAAEAKVEAARQALQRAIQAEAQANSEAAQAAQTLAQRFRAVADSLATYGRRLAESANLLDPRQALARTRADFNRVAGSRDPEVLAQMQAVADPFLDAARRAAPDAATYARELAKVRVAVDQAQRFASKEASAAEATAAQLRAANDNLLRVDESVLSVAEAQRQLADAEAELVAAQAVFESEQIKLLQQIRDALVAGTPGAANDNVWTATGYLAKNPDVKAHWDQGIPQKHGFTNEHEWAWSHWTGIGQKEGRSFATGGSFTVGGVGGPDSQFMPLWLTPGEQVDVRRPGDGAELQAEVRQLREQVRELGVSLNAALASVAQHTGKMARKLEGFEDQGMPVRGATPGAPVQTEVAA